MSRRLVGTLLKPNGAALANAKITLVATRNEVSSVLKSTQFQFTTNASGQYDEIVLDGLYSVVLDYDGSSLKVGKVTVEAGADTSLEALLSVGESATNAIYSAILTLVGEANDAEANAQASAAAAAISESNAAASEAAADADRVQTNADAAATAADRVQTGLDAAATAADRVQTTQDAIDTAADRVQTGLDAAATAADRVQTGLDAAATAADKTATNADAAATAADRLATDADATATAADRVATNADAAATAADKLATNADAAATAADRIATDADATATAADRVQTGLDASSASSDATAASSSALKAGQWAEHPNDTDIPGEAPGSRSAKHWSDVAMSAAGSLTGSMGMLGSWDASSGAPPAPSEGSTFYKITVAGTINTIDYGVGDSIVYDPVGATWFKIDNTESVTSVNGKQGVVTINKSDVGLGNVDNTSDLNKPVSTATQAAIDAVDKTDVGLGNADNTSDLNKPISNATQAALDGKSDTSHTHTKSDIGLGNVDNTSDADKPISTATQTALDNKSDTGHTHPQSDITNLETDIRKNKMLALAGI